MMNKFLSTLLISGILLLGSTVRADVPTAPFVTPPAPVFTDAERQAELAHRRAAVAAAMADKSVLILFSAEPKLYTNDVDYVFRQENNLYYLTKLKPANATLVLKKEGSKVSETVYLPKRNPARETWNGKMYTFEDGAKISGIKDILDSTQLGPFLQAVKEKKP